MEQINMANVAYIVGGTGTLGSALVKRLYGTHEIHVISRDECKQKALKNQYPDIKTHLWDIREKMHNPFLHLSINRSNQNTWYHCAALKHVDVGEHEVDQFVKTNYHGLVNCYESIGPYCEKFVFFTTDKAVFPINAYGMTKALAEKYLKSRLNINGNTEIYRWGNIIGSRGSIIETLLKDYIHNKVTTITDLKMTRYWYRINDAIDFVLRPKIPSDSRDSIYIPQDMRSASNMDLIWAIENVLKIVLKYEVSYKFRPGEKLHEDIDNYQNSRKQLFEISELRNYLEPEIKRIWGELNARI
jgi:FlaA1/EpsC-like NDP-sugar epimerase